MLTKKMTEMNPKMNMMRILQEHIKTFINWFRETIFSVDGALKMLRLLDVGPNLIVATWKGYDINNYSFYTKSEDDKSTMQNSVVSVDADSDHFSSASYNNPIRATMRYFGVIQEIWELGYIEFRPFFLSVSGSMPIPVSVKTNLDLP